MRGHWESKPTYTDGKKHINKWMAIPAMDMRVTAKKATWHFVGYLPKGMRYNHKKYVLRIRVVLVKSFLLTKKSNLVRLDL